ncbi:hypothetical protein HPB52_002335 [Rhipicephalus sanguineus]|uniref:Uncharacterized protein n=1 Tax=Rhipicephalus sanguineus TaxID=34632 RepID=A0A9D4T4R6_RHISA|nr:hypothetical protein HPB52_002335 [Rhipicephalus sanguineus]
MGDTCRAVAPPRLGKGAVAPREILAAVQSYDSSSALRLLLRRAGIQWSPEVLKYTHQDILGVLLRLSLEFGVPVLLHAVLGPWLKLPDGSRRILNLDFLLPLLPAAMSERRLSVVEDTLRLVAHNGTVFNRFRHMAEQVLRTLHRLQRRLNAASRWHGGLHYVKFSEVDKHLVSFSEPGEFLRIANEAAAYQVKRSANIGLVIQEQVCAALPSARDTPPLPTPVVCAEVNAPLSYAEVAAGPPPQTFASLPSVVPVRPTPRFDQARATGAMYDGVRTLGNVSLPDSVR